MKILAIDPGYKESAYVKFDTEKEEVFESHHITNESMLGICITDNSCELLAIESIEGFGITAGQEIFDTCWWSGRFCEGFIWEGAFRRIGRKQIKAHLCGHTRAQDKDIREALIYRYGQPGKKTAPGKLYGISGHLWAALAVAVTCADTLQMESKLPKELRDGEIVTTGPGKDLQKIVRK